jgi:uncharacterized membrane protein
LKRIKAYIQPIIKNTMLFQIAILAYFFLNESLTVYKITGILLVFIRVLVVQIKFDI